MPKGDNLRGKKSGNNLALKTSVHPSGESKSKGHQQKRALIGTIKEMIKYLEESVHEVVIDEQTGETKNISKMAAMIQRQAKKAIDQDDTRAFEALMKIAAPIQTENRNVDKDGNDVLPTIGISMPQNEIIKKLSEG